MFQPGGQREESRQIALSSCIMHAGSLCREEMGGAVNGLGIGAATEGHGGEDTTGRFPVGPASPSVRPSVRTLPFETLAHSSAITAPPGFACSAAGR